jgi:hypothetical protein
MLPHMYPDPQALPLKLGPGIKSAFQQIEIVDPATPNTHTTMFIRIAMSNLTAVNPLAPIVFVAADNNTNPAQQAKLPPPPPANSSDTVPIYKPSDPTNPVGFAVLSPAEPNNVFLVRLFIYQPGSTWSIAIQNQDTRDQEFTWVVAISDSDAKQPWGEVADKLDFEKLGKDVLAGQNVLPYKLPLDIYNKGTGPLILNNLAGTAIGTNFTIVNFTGPNPGNANAIPPNSRGQAMIAFQAPTVYGVQTETFTLTATNTNDTRVAAHTRKNATITGTVRKLEIVFLLDTSGSMSFTPDGRPANSPTDARWSKLTVATKQFLDLLGGFAGGQGSVGMAMFPDITGPNYPVEPAPSNSSADFQHLLAPISSSSIDSAKNSLDDFTAAPPGATPLGHGIGFVIGTLPTSPNSQDGYFSPDQASINRRWMVLMSDGAWNDGDNPMSFIHPSELPGLGQNNTPGTSIKDKHVRVITVAYGDRTGQNPFQVDHKLLENIVTATVDDQADVQIRNLDAGVDDNGMDLKKKFRTALTTHLELDPTSDPTGVVTSDEPDAQHRITVASYDTRVAIVVSWGTFDEERIDISVLTPNGEVITPQNATNFEGITYSSHPTYKMFVFDHSFLSNSKDPANPRYGTWKLNVHGNFGLFMEREEYDYDAITESGLRLRLSCSQPRYFAGDTIELTASLTLDGMPIPYASVMLNTTTPGQFADNLLAPAQVTEQELERARESLNNQRDVNRIGLKAQALRLKNIVFNTFSIPGSVPMIYDDGAGVYRASIQQTTTPGTYDFYVTAVGDTRDGEFFRRERRAQARVEVFPEAKYTQIHTIYEEGSAVVHFWPRDRYGNYLLCDPQTSPTFSIDVQGGDLGGDLVDNLDGSYTQAIKYNGGSEPSISLSIDGRVTIPDKVIVSPGPNFVDTVVDFTPGGDAEKGTNKFTDPQQALGSVTGRKEGSFVALGGYGSLSVRIKDQLMLSQGDADVTVFVHLNTDLRAYQVEALTPGTSDSWVLLGSSSTTQSFSLGAAGLKAAQAIRITDQSGKTRANDLSPIEAPGVNILGVGAKRIGPY